MDVFDFPVSKLNCKATVIKAVLYCHTAIHIEWWNIIESKIKLYNLLSFWQKYQGRWIVCSANDAGTIGYLHAKKKKKKKMTLALHHIQI